MIVCGQIQNCGNLCRALVPTNSDNPKWTLFFLDKVIRRETRASEIINPAETRRTGHGTQISSILSIPFFARTSRRLRPLVRVRFHTTAGRSRSCWYSENREHTPHQYRRNSSASSTQNPIVFLSPFESWPNKKEPSTTTIISNGTIIKRHKRTIMACPRLTRLSGLGC